MNSCRISALLYSFYRPQANFAKVIFSHVSVGGLRIYWAGGEYSTLPWVRVGGGGGGCFVYSNIQVWGAGGGVKGRKRVPDIPQWVIRDMVNKWVVRISLECIYGKILYLTSLLLYTFQMQRTIYRDYL